MPQLTSSTIPQQSFDYDVAVIGGGAAGLSAATALGRSRRTVLVVDAGVPRNAPAAGVHNFVTRDGLAPAELVALGRREVEHYGGVIRQIAAVAAARVPGGFVVSLADGAGITARRLIVASGLVDELPAEVAGLPERWGRDVLHCPYCHGWEVRDRAVGVLATGPLALHQAMLFRQLTDDLVFFQHTAPPLTAEQAEQLAARDVRVVAGRVSGVQTEGDRLRGVLLEDGSVVARDVLTVTARALARSGVLDSLGLRPVPHPMGAELGETYPAEPTGATALPGVWLAGNVTDMMAQVVSSAAQGVSAGAQANADLVAEDTRSAVQRRLPALR